jgi:SAM-dependent methyltransferase
LALEVLQSRSQILAGRRELRRRGLSFATSQWRTWLARYRLLPRGLRIGDHLKSWDVLKTVEFIEARVPKDAPLLDIGAFGSELPPVMHRLGYSRVSAIDLNPGIAAMPFAGVIDYRVGDFLRSPYPDGSFAAITAISVIEHGFDGAALSGELQRLLRPGGYFIASFDYWPDKISTAGIRMFDMSWTIFSRDDVARFLSQAAERGLVPCGPMQFDAQSPAIFYAERRYTFAWLVLQRAH